MSWLWRGGLHPGQHLVLAGDDSASRHAEDLVLGGIQPSDLGAAGSSPLWTGVRPDRDMRVVQEDRSGVSQFIRGKRACMGDTPR